MLSLVVMAAGLGSRYKNGIKQLAKVGKNDETIMELSINNAIKAGFDEKWYLMKTGDLNAIDILSFLRYVQKVTVGIVNRFLKEISMEIYHSNTQYSINKLLQLPEPFIL